MKRTLNLADVVVVLISVSAVMLVGCAGKSKAQLREERAYWAGQAAVLRETQPSGEVVSVVGNVGRPLISWREDLSLAQALIESDWRGRGDPRTIVLKRGGLSHVYDVRNFLRGQIEDPLLEPGDVIELVP